MTISLHTYVDPLRYFLVILRGTFLKGVGLGVQWPQMLALALLTSVLLLLSVNALPQVHRLRNLVDGLDYSAPSVSLRCQRYFGHTRELSRFSADNSRSPRLIPAAGNTSLSSRGRDSQSDLPSPRGFVCSAARGVALFEVISSLM